MSLDSGPILIADDALFLEHVAPPEHPERGERLLAVRDGIAAGAGSAHAGRAQSPQLAQLAVADATDEQLARVHDPAYVESLGLLAGRSGYLDSDTYLSPGSVAAARRAAGAAVSVVEALHQVHVGGAGGARFGLALPRPPGHHALPDRAMGFCLLNNVAVAAAHARALGHQRVLVLDWDVHHGNGTEAMFYDEPSVLFVSLHQYPNYPGTGAAEDLGKGEGRGRNVNLPLPAGATDAVYAAAFARVVLPVIEQFAPDFALVSCGFDAHARDPLAEMELSAEGFGAMTSSLLGVLDTRCPLGIVLEGGYDLAALRDSSAAVASALLRSGAGSSSSSAGTAVDTKAQPVLTPQQADALRHIGELQAPFWRLG